MTPNIIDALTLREESVLTLILEGSTSKQVGTRLGISSRTVEFHRANILGKYSARNFYHLSQLVRLQRALLGTVLLTVSQ